MKELLDALNARYAAKGLLDTFTGGITESESPERTRRPYAVVGPITEAPGCGGLKRSNKSEYLTATFEVSIVGASTFEDLSGTLVPIADEATRYAAMSLIDPITFIALFPEDVRFEWSDKYHMAHLRYVGWFAKPGRYHRT